jgi:hypothetical protein
MAVDVLSVHSHGRPAEAVAPVEHAAGRDPGRRRADFVWTTSGDAADGRALVDRLVADLVLERIHTVAYVVPSEASWTLPLYRVAITTARRGWCIGLEAPRYWFITPEPAPLASLGTAASAAASARLDPEGITFVGSTYADVLPGVVLLDPQGERIEVDRVVTLADHAMSCSPAGFERGDRVHAAPRLGTPRGGSTDASRPLQARP